MAKVLKGQGGIPGGMLGDTVIRIFDDKKDKEREEQKDKEREKQFYTNTALPIQWRQYALQLNPLNSFDSGIKNNDLRVKSGINKLLPTARQKMQEYYSSPEYARRLNQARKSTIIPNLFLDDNQTIVDNLNNRVKTVKIGFDNGEAIVNGVPGKGYTAYSSRPDHRIVFNKKYLGQFKWFPGNILGTAWHEMSHDSDYILPSWVLKYNHSLIRLNPNLSKSIRAYYGRDTEIRARAMDILMNYNQSKKKYKSLKDFMRKNINTIPAIKQLRETFDGENSLMNYMYNFAYNPSQDFNPSQNFNYYNPNQEDISYAKKGKKIYANKQFFRK